LQIHAIPVVPKKVQSCWGHAVVFRQLLWVHHTEQGREGLLHVLAHGVVVDGGGHLCNQGVEREGRKGVGHAVIHQKLAVGFVRSRDLQRHLAPPENLATDDGLKGWHGDVEDVRRLRLRYGLEGHGCHVLPALENTKFDLGGDGSNAIILD